MVLNTGPLDWETSALTTRPLGEVGNICGRPMSLGSYIGRRLNMTWLKFRIVGLIIMKGNILFMCVKSKLVCLVF